MKLRDAFYAGSVALVITGIVGGLGLAFQQPWLFPSLSLTIYIHTDDPEPRSFPAVEHIRRAWNRRCVRVHFAGFVRRARRPVSLDGRARDRLAHFCQRPGNGPYDRRADSRQGRPRASHGYDIAHNIGRPAR